MPTEFSFLKDEKSNPYARSLRDEAIIAKPIDWTVDEFISSGSLNLFCGEPKSGKTYLLMELGLCVATGSNYLNMQVKRKPVYFCFLEDAPAIIRIRGKQLGTIERMTSNDKFMFLCDYGLDSVTRGLDFLKNEQGLLIIDPIGELCAEQRLDENKATDVLTLLKDYRSICHSGSGSIIMSHHFRKDGDRMRGSTAFEAGVDGWVNVFKNKSSPNFVKLQWTMRMGKGGETGCDFIYQNDHLKMTQVEIKKTKVKNGKSNGHVKLEEDVNEHGNFANLVEEFIKTGTKTKGVITKKFQNLAKSKDVNEALDLLLSLNRITKTTGPNGSELYESAI